VHPAAYRPRISVCHDGIDTFRHAPDPHARFTLPDGRTLAAGQEIVTYAARNLEPHRGFPAFMRALPAILAARPNAEVLIAGGDGVSYGPGPEGGGTWRARMLAEVEIDPARVHLLGHLAPEPYRRLLQVSRVHVHLTLPFVLSWSALEAMATGCLIVGSDTAPVREVIEDGRNGLLADLLDPAAIAGRVIEALAAGPRLDGLRAAARATVTGRYALDLCLPRQLRLMDEVAAGREPGAEI
jgi:glycosyltransferase involved in cell wall biosynthesis